MTLHPLAQAMAHITEHPDQWDQSKWICGTTACLAGRIILQAGADPMHRCVPIGHAGQAMWRGERFTIAAIAIEVAGITESEAHLLFHAQTTYGELRHDTDRLLQDLAIDPEHLSWPAGHSHRWVDGRGVCTVAAHRRTAITFDHGSYTMVDTASRAAAHDLAGDIATARGLQYIAGPQPPEVSA